MPEAQAPADPMFPQLDDAQIARLTAFGQQGAVEAGTILFDRGDSAHGIFIVLDGSLEITGVSRDESVVRVLVRGMFTGEVNQLSGRRSLVRCRAREASSILEIGRDSVRRLFQADAAL